MAAGSGWGDLDDGGEVTAQHARRASFAELAVVAAKSMLLGLYLVALLAGIRRHDWAQTLILLAPVALGAAWHYRPQLLQLVRLDHPTPSPEPKEHTC